jgi:hypothetical protein
MAEVDINDVSDLEIEIEAQKVYDDLMKVQNAFSSEDHTVWQLVIFKNGLSVRRMHRYNREVILSLSEWSDLLKMIRGGDRQTKILPVKQRLQLPIVKEIRSFIELKFPPPLAPPGFKYWIYVDLVHSTQTYYSDRQAIIHLNIEFRTVLKSVTVCHSDTPYNVVWASVIHLRGANSEKAIDLHHLPWVALVCTEQFFAKMFSNSNIRSAFLDYRKEYTLSKGCDIHTINILEDTLVHKLIDLLTPDLSEEDQPDLPVQESPRKQLLSSSSQFPSILSRQMSTKAMPSNEKSMPAPKPNLWDLLPDD